MFLLNNINKLAHNTVVIADRQTAGKGRCERKSISVEGNIFISILIKPEIAAEKYHILPNFTQFFSVIICETLSAFSLHPEIKWPNDVASS